MKKNIFRFLILMLLISCNKDEEIKPNTSNLHEKNSKIEFVDDFLKFDSSKSLNEAIRKISFEDETIDKISAFKYSTYYNEIDTLVPNKEFRALLNAEREIQVGDTFYKITPDGTYYCNITLKDELREYIFNKAAKDISHKKSEICFKSMPDMDRRNGADEFIDGRFNLRKTFDEDDVQNKRAANNDEEGGGSYTGGGSVSKYTSQTLPPNFSRVNKTNFDAKTWAGKIIQSLIGRNVGHGRYWGNKRRVKINFYSYDYVVYSESGITAKFQKKMLFGWSGTKAPQLMIGWKNMIYSFKQESALNNFLNWQYSQTDFIEKQVNDKKWSILRSRNQTVVNELLDYFSNEDGKKALSKGSKEIVKLVKNKFKKQLDPHTDIVMLKLYCEASKKVYNIISADNRRCVNKESMTHVFEKDIHFMLTWTNSANAWYGINNWGFAQPDTFKLESGSAYGMACYDMLWQGFEIVKK